MYTGPCSHPMRCVTEVAIQVARASSPGGKLDWILRGLVLVTVRAGWQTHTRPLAHCEDGGPQVGPRWAQLHVLLFAVGAFYRRRPIDLVPIRYTRI